MCSITAPTPEREHDKGVDDEEREKTGDGEKTLSTKGTASAVPYRATLMRGLAPEVRLFQSLMSRKNVPQRLKPRREHGRLRHGLSRALRIGIFRKLEWTMKVHDEVTTVTNCDFYHINSRLHWA
jgi:hypothetical protein